MCAESFSRLPVFIRLDVEDDGNTCDFDLDDRGGASEASGATFTNHVAGNRAISDMVVYSSYITYVNTRTCANSAELAIFEIIFTGKRNSDILTWSGGLMHCTPLPSPLSQWGSGSSECGELLTSHGPWPTSRKSNRDSVAD